MKFGTKVTVKNAMGKTEPATIARTLRSMIPLPAGYVPIQFDIDGARLLVHEEYIKARYDHQS